MEEPMEEAAPPPGIRLGRRPPERRYAGLWFHDYFTPAVPPPDSVDYTPKAAASIQRMYLNDTYGDCVIAGKYHALGIWTGNASGAPILATDQEVLSAYHGICGPGDRGCIITDVLDAFKSPGLTAGGKSYRIADYVAVDWTNPNLVKFGVYLFGAVTIGVNLPNAWTSSQTWDVTNTRIVGGHDVTIVAYNATGPVVATWGGTRQMTWAAAVSTRWLEEAYLPLSPDWTAVGGLAPCGVDVATLAADLEAIKSGQAPSITPTPPPWSYEGFA